MVKINKVIKVKIVRTRNSRNSARIIMEKRDHLKNFLP